MIEIKNANFFDGSINDYFIESPEIAVIDASNYLLIPASIDPHVHFRVPGHEHKENWQTGANAAISGGITTVFDMPNNFPTIVDYKTLMEKKRVIKDELKKANIPLRYYLYLGADKNHLSEIEKCKDEIIGVKVFMGSSTGSLLIDDINTLREIFEVCKKHNLVIAAHAEDEALIVKNLSRTAKPLNYQDHSKIRSPNAALKAVETLILLCKQYQTKVYILHVSTKEELNLIEQAKKDNLPIFAEVTPHHLFLDGDIYPKFHGKALVNPPLRNKDDRIALWEAVQKNVIDCIGSDHAPHTELEKKAPYEKCPSGMPHIELTLPLLLNAYHNGLLSIEKIIDLTSRSIRNIFNLKEVNDVVLIDLKLKKKVTNMMLKTKVKWSCFENEYLTGWPICTILNGKIFKYEKDTALL